jgi:trehalose 6-phosphate phosphatase
MAVTQDDLVDSAVRAARRGVLLDFDGTIAAIVPTPSQARPLPGMGRLLASLTSKMTTVAIISSRPVSFLRSVLGDITPQPVLIGLSGIERYEAGRVHVADEAQRWTAAVREALRMAPDLLPDGADIEDKGLSLTVHYRAHPELGPQVEQVTAAVARQTGLRTHPGRMAVELSMPIAVDKGTAVRQMAESLEWILFAGDDSGDLAGFTALHDLEAADPAVRTFAVAVLSPESPPTLATSADVTVAGPVGLRELLLRLDGVLAPPAV